MKVARGSEKTTLRPTHCSTVKECMSTNNVNRTAMKTLHHLFPRSANDTADLSHCSKQRRRGKCTSSDDVWARRASYRPINATKSGQEKSPFGLFSSTNHSSQSVAHRRRWALEERRGQGQWLVAEGRPRTCWSRPHRLDQSGYQPRVTCCSMA
jgi:hypothetical protein